MMDFQNLTLAGLAAVGVVNVITFFRPALAPQVKFFLSAVAAFLIILLVPLDMGQRIAEQIKEALVIAFAASGTYTLAKRAGGQ
jgi:hypothetical protein